MKNEVLSKDYQRYGCKSGMPLFQYYFRMLQTTPSHKFITRWYKFAYRVFCKINHIEIPHGVQIGAGLYIGHAYSIIINRDTIIGENVNIHKGVTLGGENRGKRKGAPIIGNKVWIGINSTIVGNVKIGHDVLIAPNSFVNIDVPDHSIVFGNPCVIKHKENATEGYI